MPSGSFPARAAASRLDDERQVDEEHHELTEGARVAAMLGDGMGLLMAFEHRAPLRALANRRGDRLRYVARDAMDRLGVSALLVRPDGVAAWACEGEPDPEGAAEAASRWFGLDEQRRRAAG